MNYHMFSIEFITFSLLLAIFYRLRAMKPHWFAPLCGMSIFCPPNAQEIAAWKKDKEQQVKIQNKGQKTKTKQPFLNVRLVKITIQLLESLSYFQEFELVILLSLLISSTALISRCIKLFVPEFRDTSLCFYLTLVLLVLVVTNVYKISSFAGIKNSETKVFLVCAISIAFVKLLLLIGFRELVTIDLKRDLNYLYKHMDLLFRSAHNEIPYEIYLLVLVICQIPMNFAMMPAFVRFSSNYIKLKREIDSHDELPLVEKAAKRTHDKENRFNFRIFQLQIVMNLLILLLFFSPVKALKLQIETKFIMYVFVFIFSSLSLMTLKFEISLFLGKSYSFLQILMDKSDDLTISLVQRKMNAHLHSIVMVSFHILAKILIPMIFLGLIFLKRSEMDMDKIPLPKEITHISTDPRVFLSSSFCQFKPGITEISHYGAALSEFSSENVYEGVKDLVARVNKFGMVSNSWVKSIFEFFIFDFFLCHYIASILYILFLGKSETIK